VPIISFQAKEVCDYCREIQNEHWTNYQPQDSNESELVHGLENRLLESLSFAIH
jgi:hypothetical protein